MTIVLTPQNGLTPGVLKNGLDNRSTRDRFKQICIVDRLYGHSKGGEEEVGGTMEKDEEK